MVTNFTVEELNLLSEAWEDKVRIFNASDTYMYKSNEDKFCWTQLCWLFGSKNEYYTKVSTKLKEAYKVLLLKKPGNSEDEIERIEKRADLFTKALKIPVDEIPLLLFHCDDLLITEIYKWRLRIHK